MMLKANLKEKLEELNNLTNEIIATLPNNKEVIEYVLMIIKDTLTNLEGTIFKLHRIEGMPLFEKIAHDLTMIDQLADELLNACNDQNLSDQYIREGAINISKKIRNWVSTIIKTLELKEK